MKNNQRETRFPIATTAELVVFPYLLEYQESHGGLSPTLNEIAVEFERTTEWVRFCLKELQKKKLVKIERYKHRGIKIIKKK